MKPLKGLALIELTRIDPHPENIREDEFTDVAALAAAISEHGLLNPLIVERLAAGGRFRLIAGHRRYRALQRLGRTEAPCLVRGELLPDEATALMLVENTQRRDLDPIEQARALQHLISTTGISQTEAAKRIGRSQTWVSHRLQLLHLPAEEQAALRRGEVRVVHVQHKARAASPHRQADRTTYAMAEPWFTNDHRLATEARIWCNQGDHPTRGRIGGIACGACWELVIRIDAINKPTTDEGAA